MSIKILIADDHQLFREGLVNLLNKPPDIEIVGEAENGREAVYKADLLKPDIVLMDISMPELSGAEASVILKKTHPEIKIITLSMHSETKHIRQMLSEGVMGYFVKNCTYDQLIHGIEIVYSGKKYFSDEITEKLIDDYVDAKSGSSGPKSDLSAREIAVLDLIAKGISTKEIAEMLFISIKTVGSHKKNILEKLNLKTHTDLIKYAIKNKMTSLE